MDRIKLTKDIKEILNILNTHGKGYIVGGYIRDYLLGLTPKDCDFCTDIDYSKLKDIFKDYSPKEIGKAFGIIQIVYNGKSYEIAKLRKDVTFTSFRNIAEVEFINDIYEDLKRRDFTVNAIAYNGSNLIYLSQVEIDDIKNRVLRFVGNGKKRIEEDPLRILRGIRIAGEKKLLILEKTKQEIKECKNEIKRVSIERVQDEFFKMLKGENSSNSFKSLYELGVFEELFPKTHKNIKLNEVLEDLDKIDSLFLLEESLVLKLVVIFNKSKDELNYLKLDNKSKKSILNIIENLEKIKNISSKYEIKKMIMTIGLEDFKNILKIENLRDNISLIKEKFNEILINNEPIFMKALAISGKDILDLEIKDGKKIKELLEKSLDIVLKNPELNQKNYLLKLIEEEKI
ncbi:CCA tRNA nucleotidyltransferase [Cetobacterium somerae]|uniref:CCA tRNA nucleotidyltransferase n=2 Tax=Fusobacteriaceae TaxID=203492 RepID=UPI001F05E0F8|nr:CCA tRNA nucleotidyltransferase [Cetobacterium somerae]MCX3067473.1 CCA tRNA nucleotidyltransferase [Cetobacterium somerae]UPO96969.1 CCA tRNA nucleotidyltransferase [Cetobacterium somerae]